MQNSQYHPSFHSMLPRDHLKKRRKKKKKRKYLLFANTPTPIWQRHFLFSTLKLGHGGTANRRSTASACAELVGPLSKAIWHFPVWCGVRCIAHNFSGGCDNCKMPRPLFTLKSGTGTRAGAVCLTQGWQQWCHAARQEQASPFSAEHPQFQQQNPAGSSLPAQG